MSTIGPGDQLPDIRLAEPDGDERSLAGFRGEHTLLIFLRHLA